MKIEVSKDTAQKLAIHSATIGEGVNKIAEAFIRTQLDMYDEQKRNGGVWAYVQNGTARRVVNFW